MEKESLNKCIQENKKTRDSILKIEKITGKKQFRGGIPSYFCYKPLILSIRNKVLQEAANFDKKCIYSNIKNICSFNIIMPNILILSNILIKSYMFMSS